jgi:hypothetical protein
VCSELQTAWIDDSGNAWILIKNFKRCSNKSINQSQPHVSIQSLPLGRDNIFFPIENNLFTSTFWDIAPCSPYMNRCFGRLYHLHRQGWKSAEKETSMLPLSSSNLTRVYVTCYKIKSDVCFKTWVKTVYFFLPSFYGLHPVTYANFRVGLQTVKRLLERGISSSQGHYLRRATQACECLRFTSVTQAGFESTIPLFAHAKTYHVNISLFSLSPGKEAFKIRWLILLWIFDIKIQRTDWKKVDVYASKSKERFFRRRNAEKCDQESDCGFITFWLLETFLSLINKLLIVFDFGLAMSVSYSSTRGQVVVMP